ncbi:MAG: hypothetical protein LBL48_04845 [Azoarcus sp.]|jgi:hypothetical protein|nr:hypothetical protein [Azoarcus sp.]
MARITRARTVSPAPRADAAAAAATSSVNAGETDDLAILNPDVTLTLAGEEIVVRELRFGEQLKHGQALSEFANALRPLLSAPEDEDNAVLDLLSRHWRQMSPIVAQSVGRDTAFVESLKADEGEALMLAWWRVNHGFFLRRFLRRFVALRGKNPEAGAGSSPPSSGTDTAPAT